MATVPNLLVGAGCGLLWMGLAAPAILRTFGVPVAFGIWRIDRRNQSLHRTQYVWACGVLTWGVGMFLFSVISDYLDWKRLGYSVPMRIFGALLTWLAAGWLFGVWTAPRRENADSTTR